MRVVSIGDLVTDYYYKNEKFLGINGGMTSHNIIANLAKMGINTAVFGTCGNDIQGEIAIKSLEKLDVDVIIYVGSGDFHALGVKLFTQKPVILADPFIGKSRNIEEFYDRILRVRFARITKASSAKSFGIIMSSKKGQLRFDLAIHLKKLIKDHGFDAQILNMD